MSDWQPIETAPKDGTWILGSSPSAKYSQGYALKPESIRWGTYHPNAKGDVQWRALDG